MKIKKTPLDGVLEIELDSFKDFRGEYLESFNKNDYISNGISLDFVQDDFSISSKNVLRGIHGDQNTWKLVSCLYGSFFFSSCK